MFCRLSCPDSKLKASQPIAAGFIKIDEPTQKAIAVTILLEYARGAMVWGSEWLLVKQEDLGLIPTQTKCFFSPWEVGIKMDPDRINCVILRFHVDKKDNNYNS